MSKKIQSLNNEIVKLESDLDDLKMRLATALSMFREETAMRSALEKAYTDVRNHLFAVLRKAMGKTGLYKVPTKLYGEAAYGVKITKVGEQLQFEFAAPEAQAEDAPSQV